MGGFGASPPLVAHSSFFEMSATDSEGKVVPLSDYAGNVCLVANVASK